MTCNEWLGDAPEDHLIANPTHIASEIMYDDEYYTTDTLLAEPMTRVFNGELYMYDATRQLYISVNRHQVQWGYRRNNVRNSWLRLSGALNTNSKKAGHLVAADALITKIVFSRVSGGEATVYICKNYDKRDIVATASIPNKEIYTLDITADTEIDQGETLHCYHECRDGSSDPYVSIEYAWRIS
jgi:hypothetical protein